MSIEWEPHYRLGQPNENYLHGEYRGMHCELFFNNRLGHGPEGWDWSFYDDASGDPELAVARSETPFPTKEAAEVALRDYIDGYIPEEG